MKEKLAMIAKRAWGLVSLGLVLGAAACGSADSGESKESEESVASTIEALGDGTLDYSDDVGHGVSRVVKETCGKVCVKSGRRSSKTHQPTCSQWANTCDAISAINPDEVRLFADKAAEANGTVFPAYNQGSNQPYMGCGPAAIQNVLAYYGIYKRIQEVAPMVSTTVDPRNGDIASSPDDVAGALKIMLNVWGDGEFAVDRISHSGNIRLDIRQALLGGDPVIMLVHGGSHYQVATGISYDQYHVIDYVGQDTWVKESDIGFDLTFPAAWGGFFSNGSGGYVSETFIRIKRTPKPRWHDPLPLPAPPDGPVFKTGGGIAAVSRDSTLLNSFAIGFDGKLWSTGDWGNEMWNWPIPIVGAQNDAVFTPGGGIAAVSRDSSLLETYTIGYDGQLWNAGSYMNQAWQPAFLPIRSSATFTPGGGVAAVSRTSKLLDTFAIGYDGVLWDTGWWDPNGWHPAYQVPHDNFQFKAGAGIAAVSHDTNSIDTFVIGNDGQLWNAGNWQTDHWNTAYKVPTDPAVIFPVGAQIAATYRDGVINTWVIGNDSQLWNAGWWDGRWHPPYKVPTSSATFTAGGGLAAATRLSQLDNVLTIGNDQRTWNSWYGR
jgi:hypothetical protein